MITWTIGAGGMLGRALRRQTPDTFVGSAISWDDTSSASATLTSDLDRFRRDCAGRPWGIIWAAGSATVSSSEADTAGELHTLDALLSALRADPPSGPGAFFLTSSAGGVFAGSLEPPFNATTVPRALSPYGELKLRQEATTRHRLDGVCPVVIGRFSNLYGPGQNLDKLQGLISRLALAAVTRQPLNVFVSLDTIRDYIYVDDAAAIALWWLEDAIARQPAEPQLSIIATGEGTTVGQLIRTTSLVTKRRVPVALGNHSSARNQVLDLRLEPTDQYRLSTLARTPLPTGVRMVYLDVLQRVQQAAATSPSFR